MLRDTDAGKRVVIDVEEGEIGEELMQLWKGLRRIRLGRKPRPVTLVDL
jgi:hypothetical protein